MELNVVKGEESRSDLQVSISEWENKMMNIEKQNIFVESGP